MTKFYRVLIGGRDCLSQNNGKFLREGDIICTGWGLFMPSNAEGTWIMLIDPRTNDTRSVYIEPRVIVSPFPLSIN